MLHILHTPGELYILYKYSWWALHGKYTFLVDSTCNIHIPGGLYVLYMYSCQALHFIYKLLVCSTLHVIFKLLVALHVTYTVYSWQTLHITYYFCWALYALYIPGGLCTTLDQIRSYKFSITRHMKGEQYIYTTVYLLLVLLQSIGRGKYTLPLKHI